MAERAGYRGYIASRPIDDSRVPQHVQNLVLRDYARRHGLLYLLSATEYAMPGCFMMLQQVLDELERIEGVLCYSVFMLPGSRERRQRIYDRLFETGTSLHGAVESIRVATPAEAAALEDILSVHALLPHTPRIL